MHKRLLRIIAACAVLNISRAVVEFENWAYHFPSGSNMGIFVALAIPIEVPNENVFVAYNFEANYLLPENYSETVEYPPLVSDEEVRYSKKIERSRVYEVIKTKLELHGYPGQDCLLRTICECSISSLEPNGVLGDIIHIILSPSSSVDLGMSDIYSHAEEYGRTNGNCNKYCETCETSFLDIITWLGNAI